MKSLLFVYLLSYGGAALAVFIPYIGLFSYITLAIIKPDVLWWWSVPEGNYSRVVGVAMLLGWAIQGFGTWQFGRGRAIARAFFAYWICMVASSITASESAVAWKAVDAMAKILIPFVLGLTVIDSADKLKKLIWVIVLSLGYVAYEENVRYFRFGGLSVDETSNMLAHQMAAGTFLALFTALHVRRLPAKVIGLLIAALMAHTVAIHMSRGAMVGLCAGALATLLVLRKSPGKFVFCLAGLCVAGILAGPATQKQFLTIFRIDERINESKLNIYDNNYETVRVKPESAEERLQLWRALPQAAMRRPLFGVGPEHWPLIAAEYGFPPGKQGHNLWLQTAVELGLLGLASYLGFFGLAVVRLWACLWSKPEVFDPWILAGIQMSLVSTFTFIIESNFGNFHREVETFYYTVLIGAVGLRLVSRVPTPVAPSVRLWS